MTTALLYISTYAPPLTLTEAERAAVESFDPPARQRFEELAARYEFGEHRTTAEAESLALQQTISEFSIR